MLDHYLALAKRAEYHHKVERSDFLGIAFPATSEDEFFVELQHIEKRYFDATHHCWAFRLRERLRSSDAGEPSGTAGKPILSAIEGASLFETAVVVVRWFGGVKLGTGGLSRAYRDTAAETLRQAKTIDRYEYERFRVVVPFDMMSHAYRLVDPPNVILVEETFADRNEFVFDVRRSRADDFARTLTDRRFAFTLR